MSIIRDVHNYVRHHIHGRRKCGLRRDCDHGDVGDEVEVFGPNTSVKSFKIESILNDEDEYVFSASHAQEIVKIKVPFDVCENDIIRVKIS